MKKILAVALASLICSMAAFEALAFEPETVEAAGEKAELSKTETALAAASIDGFAYEDETYGTLLYYNNFESGSADSPTYRNMDYLADYTVLVQPANAPGSVTLTADPADAANTVLRAQRSSGALFGVQFSMRDADNQYVHFATKHGKYTIVADIYVTDSDPSVNLVGTIWYPSWSHSGGAYRFGTPSAGAWSKNNVCDTHTAYPVMIVLSCSGRYATGAARRNMPTARISYKKRLQKSDAFRDAYSFASGFHCFTQKLFVTLKRYIRFFGSHGLGTAYPIRRNSRSTPKHARSNSGTCRDAFARQ